MGLFEKFFSRTISQNDFAALLSKHFKKAGIEILDFDQDEFRLTLEGHGVVFLVNCYANYCSADRSNRNAVLDKFVQGLTTGKDTPNSFELAKPNLIPIIRSASYYSLAQLQSLASGETYPGHVGTTKVLSEDLVIGLAFDTEHSMRLVNRSSFDIWGIDIAEALRVAEENLRDRTDPTQIVEPSSGIFVGLWDDSYETSRILLTDMIHRLSVHGDPVVFLPSRNQFLVTGSKNLAGLKWMIEIGEKSHFEAYPLSPNLFVWANDRWSLFFPEDSELLSRIVSIERRRLALDYGQQKQYLEAIRERDGIDIFVASFTIYEVNETKQQYSLCVWSKGVDSLLPITDKVLLLIDPETKDRVVVAWDRAVKVVGHRIEEQADVSPPRYRVRTFPSDSEISLLREE